MNFKQLKNSILKKGLGFNILTLVTGTTVAQLIPILIQPFLRRTFEPEDFGLFSVYTSIIGITTIFYSLRYPFMINVPKNEVVAKNVFSLSLIIALGFTFLSYFLILIFGNHFLLSLNIPSHKGYYLYLVPLSSLLYASFQIINFWLIRIKQFKLASLNKIYRRASEGIVNVSFGIINRPIGLVLGDISGNIINNISGALKLKRIGFNFKSVTIKRLGYVMKRYSDMPLYNTLPAIFNSMCLYLPALFINKYYSSTYAGYFHLTTLVLNVPIVFIGKSISEAMIQRVSEKRHKKLQIGGDVFNLMKTLVFFGFLMIVVIWTTGPFVFKIFFGKDYFVSGEYAQIFVILAAIRLVISPLNNVIFFILEKNKVFAIWQTFFFLAILLLPLLTYLSFEHFIWAIVLISTFFYLIAFLLILSIVSRYDKSLQ